MTQAKNLSEQQYQFVINYVRNGFNAYQAALSAGYSENMAKVESHKILARPYIREQIDKAKDQIDSLRTKELANLMAWKIRKLKRVVDDFIPDDKDIPLLQANVAQALKAISELNKMSGDYAPERRLALTVDATKDKLKEIQKTYEEY